ncbi:MAG: hypothetical protein OEL77_08360 [Nitrosopumilus sp.]|nr:hypothetical protein [Nitrosopumilus sp.]MDH3386008.1 hypothetical protein [Nitrosopumilus sp.]
MKNYFDIFLIIVAIIIIPDATAQIPGEDSKQKSVTVTISLTGEMQVEHVIEDLNVPSQIELINGTKSYLTVKDQEGNSVQYGEIGGDSLMILPSDNETIIEYDLENELTLKDNVWTLDFFYLESTAFIFPKKVNLIFVNNQPAYLGEKDGIVCHGCKMFLEFSMDEPKIFESVKIQDSKFLIEIRTVDKINQFIFDPSKGISFEVIDGGKWVTTILPVNLLSKPYQVFLDDEKIRFQTTFNNDTHVWLNMKPQNSGEISIIGTLVPEIKISPEESIQLEVIVVGIIIIGAVITGIFFLKRKKI